MTAQGRLETGWGLTILYFWLQTSVSIEWMKVALNFRKLIPKKGSWNWYLRGKVDTVFFPFSFLSFFILINFALLYFEVYLFIWFFSRTSLLGWAFHAMPFFFSSLFIYISLYMSVLSLHIKDCLSSETTANHSYDEACRVGLTFEPPCLTVASFHFFSFFTISHELPLWWQR